MLIEKTYLFLKKGLKTFIKGWKFQMQKVGNFIILIILLKCTLEIKKIDGTLHCLKSVKMNPLL